MIEKEALRIYIQDNMQYGDYEGETFYIIETWEQIRYMQKTFQGIEVDYDVKHGSGLLTVGQLLSYIDSDVLYPVSLDDIESMQRGINLYEVVKAGQLSFIPMEIISDVEYMQYKSILSLFEKNEGNMDDLNYDLLYMIPEVEWGFSDEYTTCSNCCNVIRTSPDSYNWTPDFYLGDGEILCSECAQNSLDDAIQEIQEAIDLGDSPKSLPFIFDLGSDWVQIESDSYDGTFQVGLHESSGRDNPTKQGQYIRSIKNEQSESIFQVVFRVYPSQFETDWKVYVRVDPNIYQSELYQEKEVLDSLIEVVTDGLNSNETKDKYSQGQLMAKALREDIKQVNTHFNHITVNTETGEITITGTDNFDEF